MLDDFGAARGWIMADRFFALTFYSLALACGCLAALLTLAGFIEYLQLGRWPDQSLLRFAYDSRVLQARWLLASQWGMPLRDLLAWLPAAWVALGLAPLLWWLGGLLARR